MKTFKKHILWAALLMLTLWSCEEKSNLQPEGNWDLSAPALMPLNGDNKLVLDEANPHGKITFNWEAAVSSAKYGVYYTVVIDSLNASDVNQPIIQFKSLEGGKSNSASITNLELNDALYMAGFLPGQELELQWAVQAVCLSKMTSDEADVTVTRYDDDKLFLSGSATEVGDNVTNAIKMMRLSNGAGEKLKLYESYTELKANEGFMVFNGRSENAIAYGVDNEGKLVRDGQPITVDADGVYRINIDFETMSISFHKVDRLGLIGSPLAGGWGADEALEYIGMGVWQSDISFPGTGGYIIRANNNWEGIIKHKSGSVNDVVREDFGNEQGIAFEDFQQNEAGLYTVTLTLDGNNYTMNLEKAPEQRMYVIANGTDAYELTMVGDGIFATTSYIALQTTDNVLVNTKADGSGISYSISDAMGQGDDNKVEATASMSESTTPFSPVVDQAYGFVIDVKTGELKWHYYNLKLFHWDEVGGGWDTRTETLLSYSHPFTFTATADLQAGYHSKVFSPWEILFGAATSEDVNALSGNMLNDGGAANIDNISTSGSYDFTLTITADYSTGTFEFVSK
ncbi:SusE domain-containing protein [Carboxylicivirga sediminis]|uniref:SusE domain-containing protein n=1 Tax=Carboxylicivirga sediminis TaxID=2006564 RepID=A0A941IYG9_9BACT|nr:SusE domain-containing protein [Carboxylicivirga sediminis]MBR8536985.1 SusE domain-containing protein [Carboxylicivirga sediminis]